jgi:hypothetical protein
VVSIDEDQVVLQGREGRQHVIEITYDAGHILNVETSPDVFGMPCERWIAFNRCHRCGIFAKVSSGNAEAGAQFEDYCSIQVTRKASKRSCMARPLERTLGDFGHGS